MRAIATLERARPSSAPSLSRAAARRRPLAPAASSSSALRPSPQVVSPETDASRPSCRVVVFVPAEEDSFMHYPPALVARGRFSREAPSFGEVFEHLARRVAWTDTADDAASLGMDVVSTSANEVEMMRVVGDADVFIAIGVKDEETSERIRRATAACATGCALDSPFLEADERICYQPTRDLRKIRAKLTPWSQAAKDVRLMDQVKELYERKNHTDALVMILLLVDASGFKVPMVAINQDITLGNVWCIASNCNKQLLACYKNPQCRKSLDCVDGCGLNDQVCTYTCIRSYQNVEFEMLARCMLHKHNCLNNDATRPQLPEVLPMKTWRGNPLTHETAERIMQGWLGTKDPKTGETRKYSHLACAGNNEAYDSFPCQFQIWYRGKGKNVFWYNPVFKVNTLDGKTVWRRSDYRCRRAETPGTFIFSFMDNGVTSEEFWRIVDAADDLSWALFYYAGAAKSAGQMYIGAVLATPDGLWPAEDQMPRVEDALWRGCGIKIWEMISVDNSTAFDGDAPLLPLHEVVLMAD